MSTLANDNGGYLLFCLSGVLAAGPASFIVPLLVYADYIGELVDPVFTMGKEELAIAKQSELWALSFGRDLRKPTRNVYTSVFPHRLASSIGVRFALLGTVNAAPASSILWAHSRASGNLQRAIR